MLETAIGDRLKKFGLEKHILERSAVDASVGSGLGGSSGATVLGSIIEVVFEDVIFVVGEVSGGRSFTVNHFDSCFKCLWKLVSVRCVCPK